MALATWVGAPASKSLPAAASASAEAVELSVRFAVAINKFSENFPNHY
jgi:hypothetical protein